MAEPPPARLREHSVTLLGDTITLRPLAERDWETLLRWNDDPAVLYFSEGDDIKSQTVEDLQRIYRPISQRAFCFVIEQEERPVGDCWLQEINLGRILERERGRDCRRIDLMLERLSWGRRIGTASVRLLVEFAFTNQRADAVFACDVGDNNERSQRLFQGRGFQPYGEVVRPPGNKAERRYDLCLRREEYFADASIR